MKYILKLQIYMKFEDGGLAWSYQEALLKLSVLFLPLSYARISQVTPEMEVRFVGKTAQYFLNV